jgi:hypothetical protein
MCPYCVHPESRTFSVEKEIKIYNQAYVLSVTDGVGENSDIQTAHQTFLG